MLTIKQGKQAIDFSRSVIKAIVTNTSIEKTDLPECFQKNHGVFTTLHTYPSQQLRGCIGIPEPIMSLEKALIESGKSVTHDPRFPVLQSEELDQIIVEITILTKPEVISCRKEDILDAIIIGRHGLIIEQGFFKGLLLPQVPIEQKWDTQTFIEHTCMKAGLPPDAWMHENTIIKTFTGQIFAEEKPKGPVKEKTFDET